MGFYTFLAVSYMLEKILQHFYIPDNIGFIRNGGHNHPNYRNFRNNPSFLNSTLVHSNGICFY